MKSCNFKKTSSYAESVVQYQTSEWFELLKLYVTATNTGVLALDGKNAAKRF